MEKVIDEILEHVEHLYGLSESQKEIAKYGIQGVFEIGSNLIISVLILWQMHMVLEGIVFFLVFIPVRMFSGGYHMESYIGCFIFSIITLIGVLKGAEMISLNRAVLYAAIILMAVVILRLAPVIHPNRPVSQRERQRIRKRLKLSLLIILFVAGVFLILQKNQWCSIIFLDFLLLTIMLFAGRVKYKTI